MKRLGQKGIEVKKGRRKRDESRMRCTKKVQEHRNTGGGSVREKITDRPRREAEMPVHPSVPTFLRSHVRSITRWQPCVSTPLMSKRYIKREKPGRSGSPSFLGIPSISYAGQMLRSLPSCHSLALRDHRALQRAAAVDLNL